MVNRCLQSTSEHWSNLILTNLSFCLNLHYVQVDAVIGCVHRCLHTSGDKALIHHTHVAHALRGVCN